MRTHIDIDYRFNERLQREIEYAADQRGPDRTPGSLRRTVGRSLIAIGTRVAAEPSLKLARSR
jgi:hypothetical protein